MGGSMAKLTTTAKPLSTEERLEKVLAVMVMDRINLYLDLKKVLGEKEGTEVFKKLYDEGIKRIRKNAPGGKLSILELMKREMISFPVLGFELTFDHEIENGEDVYYEHLTKCPFLDMAKKMGIAESPCDFICGYDVELAHRDKRGRWEIISMMGKGGKECQFRIRDWKD
jgi:hypothetical protein